MAIATFYCGVFVKHIRNDQQKRIKNARKLAHRVSQTAEGKETKNTSIKKTGLQEELKKKKLLL